MDDDGRHIDATKRHLIERATKLLGQDELARRLNVASTLLGAWVRGDITMPDGKLMDLARVLDNISREERTGD
jgi:DNA-binding transcriptional regulator YdaS (Cro superfamily)